jgi:hypothetical protein
MDDLIHRPCVSPTACHNKDLVSLYNRRGLCRNRAVASKKEERIWKHLYSHYAVPKFISVMRYLRTVHEMDVLYIYIEFVLSVCPHVSTREPLDVFG